VGGDVAAERAQHLNKIADRLEENLEAIAVIETIDNGKPIRETMAADLPLAVDHFRYFAGCIRAQEGSSASSTRHGRVPLPRAARRGGADHPVELPAADGGVEARPALAAGNAVVLKPAEQTPVSIMAFAELIADLLPPGVLNVVQGFGIEAGKPLASSNRIAKVAFTGETTTGRLIMQYASENIIPVTLELGGKSPNIFFGRRDGRRRRVLRQGARGLRDVRANQGEVCTCPSRALVQESIYDRLHGARRQARRGDQDGHPLDPPR
jgi:aldehyde dehydrogenase